MKNAITPAYFPNSKSTRLSSSRFLGKYDRPLILNQSHFHMSAIAIKL
ncbi:MAG: hypothetical protein KME52_06135 [Desmonostoc geniculatum HA4340-LM1]|nr:hypothetical protein [Desmonostoc geniculatum HA4340-LM1]